MSLLITQKLSDNLNMLIFSNLLAGRIAYTSVNIAVAIARKTLCSFFGT
jgi:phosphotransacetylase